jgi:D-lactate dehydrogenase
MIQAAMYDTKPHDRDNFHADGPSPEIHWTFHEFRLDARTATLAAGCISVCAFVNDRVDRACLEALAACGVRHVALRCAGFNQVDLAAARTLGVRVTRVPAYSPYAVAEHTLALVLALNRKVHRAYNRVREHNFSLAGLVGFDLHGKTVGLVGTGKIGRVTAGIFRGFGTRVLASDPSPDSAWAEAAGVEYAPWDRLLVESDILSLHAPLTPSTHHLLSDTAIAKMKPGAMLVNTSRGKLVDTRALLAALKSGHLGGVALDVYEEEEGVFFEDLSGQILGDDDLARLLTFPNVLVTAHQAFLTREALAEIARVTRANIRAAAAGEDPLPGTVV